MEDVKYERILLASTWFISHYRLRARVRTTGTMSAAVDDVRSTNSVADEERRKPELQGVWKQKDG